MCLIVIVYVCKPRGGSLVQPTSVYNEITQHSILIICHRRFYAVPCPQLYLTKIAILQSLCEPPVGTQRSITLRLFQLHKAEPDIGLIYSPPASVRVYVVHNKMTEYITIIVIKMPLQSH